MIKSVRVQNFRTHSDFTADFSDGVNVIIGKNGIGKTSLIEAVYIALSGKSWRSNFDSITRQGQDWWRADVAAKDGLRTVKYTGEKAFELDGKTHLRLPNSKKPPVVLFEPDDLNLLYGSPARRRHYVDKLLKYTDDEFNTIALKFEKVLKQRNALLKNQASSDQLFVWDLQFADLAAQIIAKRQEIIETLDKKLSREYNKIAKTKDSVHIKYDSDGANTKQEIINQLQKNHQLETLTGSTSIGPQKHDILFTFKNQPAATAASRGENRSIILALKNIEYQIKKIGSQKPLILLDDIMSEFDAAHQANLLENYKNSQVIITSVVLPRNLGEINIIKL
jgi:DNA replication and repair protein RecF